MSGKKTITKYLFMQVQGCTLNPEIRFAAQKNFKRKKLTLLLNEFHSIDGLAKTFIVAAADRQIITFDGVLDTQQQKLFGIPAIRGAVSFFGHALVYPKNGLPIKLSEWLSNFITENSSLDSIKDFAYCLREALAEVMPTHVLKENWSGFHICGYTKNGLPDFWYFSNIGSMTEFKYDNFTPEYSIPESHFLDRDARTIFKWDGENPHSAKNGSCVYRNGDIRLHVAAWEMFENIYAKIAQFPDFKMPKNPQEYGDYLKFQFELLAHIYEKRADKKIIGLPIDVIVLTSADF